MYKIEQKTHKKLSTVELRVLTRVTNSEINFLSKGYQYISIKNSLHKQSDKASMYSKQDGLVLATLRYLVKE